MELSTGYRQENSPGSLSREKVTQWLSWWFRFRSVVAILVACSLITHPTVFIRISCHKKIHHQPSTCSPLKNRLLDQSKRKQVPPDQFSYSASMSACHKCGRWNEALAILAKMKDPRWRFGLVGPSWKAEGRYRIRLFPMGIDCHCEWCFGFIQLVCCKWQVFRNLEPRFFWWLEVGGNRSLHVQPDFLNWCRAVLWVQSQQDLRISWRMESRALLLDC